MLTISDNQPLVKRRGCLKNGNPSGDPSKASRCGARSKRTTLPCRSPAMKNGRCRMHGGFSTGPKTLEGLMKSHKANWKNGKYSAESKLRRKHITSACREALALCRELNKSKL